MKEESKEKKITFLMNQKEDNNNNFFTRKNVNNIPIVHTLFSLTDTCDFNTMKEIEGYENESKNLNYEEIREIINDKDNYSLRFQRKINHIAYGNSSRSNKMEILWYSNKAPGNTQEIIEFAEENGSIRDIGNWVLDKGMYFGMENVKNGIIKNDEKIDINVSCIQITDGFSDYVIQIAQKNSFPLNKLGLELTESKSFINDKVAINELKKLKDLGVSIALDDFLEGTNKHDLFEKLFREGILDEIKFSKNITSRIFGNDVNSKQNKDIFKEIIIKTIMNGSSITLEGVKNDELYKFERLYFESLEIAYNILNRNNSRNLYQLLRRSCLYIQSYMFHLPEDFIVKKE